MTAPTITAAWLERQGACPEQVARFRATFGESASVTPETIATARETRLGLGWLCNKVLADPAWKQYAGALCDAWAAYVLLCDAWAAYVLPSAQAMDDTRNAAIDEYERVMGAALVALLAEPANWREGWDA